MIATPNRVGRGYAGKRLPLWFMLVSIGSSLAMRGDRSSNRQVSIYLGGLSVNGWLQGESLIDNTESLFDLKRIVVRSLILLVCGRKEVCTCLYAAQVEINGYLLLGSAGDRCSGPFSDDAISVLITSDCY